MFGAFLPELTVLGGAPLFSKPVSLGPGSESSSTSSESSVQERKQTMESGCRGLHSPHRPHLGCVTSGTFASQSLVSSLATQTE